MQIAIELSMFIGLAFCSGLIYPAFYAIIGAPQYVPNPYVGHQFPGVQLLGISKPGMIFRWYGKWLCKRQNAFERKHDKSLIHFFHIDISNQGRIKSQPYFRTSYGRESELHAIPAIWHPDIGISIILSTHVGPDVWEVVVKLLPGESAAIEYTDIDGVRKTAYSEPMYPDFDRSKMPLSIYKVLGLCGLCFTFWLCAAIVIAGCIMGMYPFSLLYFLPVAYGVSVFASSLYEV